MAPHDHAPPPASSEPVQASPEEVRARGLLGRQAAAWILGGSVALMAGPVIGHPLGVPGPVVRGVGAAVVGVGASTAVASVGEDWVAPTRRAVAANVVLAGALLAAATVGRGLASRVVAAGLAGVSGAVAAAQVRVLVEEQGPVIA